MRQDYRDLDPATHCTTHGKPLIPHPWSTFCEDCEGEPDGEDFRGGERRAYEQDQQAEIQETLK